MKKLILSPGIKGKPGIKRSNTGNNVGRIGKKRDSGDRELGW